MVGGNGLTMSRCIEGGIIRLIRELDNVKLRVISLTDGCAHSIVSFVMSLENAILETLAYSDIFDYPLNFDELHRYLVVPASREHVLQSVNHMDKVGSREGYY